MARTTEQDDWPVGGDCPLPADMPGNVANTHVARTYERNESGDWVVVPAGQRVRGSVTRSFLVPKGSPPDYLPVIPRDH
jgi:hypothetical protein